MSMISIVVRYSDLVPALKTLQVFDQVLDVPNPNDIPKDIATIVQQYGITNIVWIIRYENTDPGTQALANIGWKIVVLTESPEQTGILGDKETVAYCSPPWTLPSILATIMELPGVTLDEEKIWANISTDPTPAYIDTTNSTSAAPDLPPPPSTIPPPAPPTNVSDVPPPPAIFEPVRNEVQNSPLPPPPPADDLGFMMEPVEPANETVQDLSEPLLPTVPPPPPADDLGFMMEPVEPANETAQDLSEPPPPPAMAFPASPEPTSDDSIDPLAKAPAIVDIGALPAVEEGLSLDFLFGDEDAAEDNLPESNPNPMPLSLDPPESNSNMVFSLGTELSEAPSNVSIAVLEKPELSFDFVMDAANSTFPDTMGDATETSTQEDSSAQPDSDTLEEESFTLEGPTDDMTPYIDENHMVSADALLHLTANTTPPQTDQSTESSTTDKMSTLKDLLGIAAPEETPPKDTANASLAFLQSLGILPDQSVAVPPPTPPTIAHPTPAAAPHRHESAPLPPPPVMETPPVVPPPPPPVMETPPVVPPPPPPVMETPPVVPPPPPPIMETPPAAPSPLLMDGFVPPPPPPPSGFLTATSTEEALFVPSGQDMVGTRALTDILPKINSNALNVPQWGIADDGQRVRDKTLGMVISAIVPKGGTGKTSFTIACAVRSAQVLHQQGKRVCLVEANVQQANISRYLGVEGRVNTLSMIAREHSITPDVVRRVITSDDSYHLDILFGSSKTEDVDPAVLTPKFYRAVVQQLIKEYDYIWIDAQSAEAFRPIFTEFLLPMSDRLMVVLSHNQIAIEQTIEYLQSITSPRHSGTGQGVSMESVGIVLNQYRADAKLSLNDIKAQLNAWTWWGQMPYYQDWQDANSDHRIHLDKAVCRDLDLILYKALGGEVAFSPGARAGRMEKSGKKRKWLGK